MLTPPWNYSNKRKKIGGGIPYNSMSQEEICNLNIDDISSDNSALFIWITNPHLENAIQVMRKWGFQYKTIGFTWIKYWPNLGFWSAESKKGMEYYVKNHIELCLLGIRGKMKPISHKVNGNIFEPRDMHSKKPDIVRDKIIELFGNLTRIELFARQKTEGWDIWGNELENDIKL